MRVLHVTETYATGVARAIVGVVNASPEHEHFLLWSGFETPPADGPFAATFKFPEGSLTRLNEVPKRAREYDADVVHLHSSWAGVYGRARKLPAKVIYQPHCFAFEDLSRPRWQRAAFQIAERFLGRNTDVVAAVSERERTLARRFAPRAEVVLVPNQSNLEALAERARTQTGRPRIVMSGEIRRQKGPEVFAATAQEVRAHGVDADFVWIGFGDPDRESELTNAGVRVTGWLGPDGVQAELDEASLYLHTASYEGFPLSILDATARRVPILARQADWLDGMQLTTFVDSTDAAAMIVEHLFGREGAATANLEKLTKYCRQATTEASVRALYGATK